MLTHIEASYLMDYIIAQDFKFVKKTGYLYPSLYVLNKGTEIDITLKNPSILEIQSAEITPGNYCSVVAFQNRDSQDEAAMKEVSQKIAKAYYPDAIGCVAIYLYREFNREDVKDYENYEGLLDPEATRIIHSIYYLRGDKKSFLKSVPFVDRGVKPGNSIPRIDADEERDSERDLIVVQTAWQPYKEGMECFLQYPY